MTKMIWLALIGLGVGMPKAHSEVCPLEIVPGKKFGAIEIGMSKEELKKLGLQLKSNSHEGEYVSSHEQNYEKAVVGPYWITLKNDEVVEIRSSDSKLPRCLNLESSKISLAERERVRTMEKLQKRYAGCAQSLNGVGVQCKEGLTVFWNARGADVKVGL